MKIQTNTVIAVVLGVVITGLIFRFAGDLPVLNDARRGIDGNVK